MLTVTEEQQKNWEIAGQINREARVDPNSPYAGKYVGLFDGQVVAVAATLDEVIEAMARIDPDPQRGTVIEASADYDRTYYIWRQT
jgi:FKBP-type peptidyl-prolyl cis-trans isomerase 2